jgi:hypothetical protein
MTNKWKKKEIGKVLLFSKKHSTKLPIEKEKTSLKRRSGYITINFTFHL